MRLINYSISGRTRLGCAVGAEVLDANGFVSRSYLQEGYDLQTAERMANQSVPSDLGDVLAAGADGQKRLQAVLDRVARLSAAEKEALRKDNILCDPAKIRYLPPLAANATIFAVGRNYAEHVAEAGSQIPTLPAIFMRTHNSVVGHRQALLRPKLSHHFDWEVELAVIIGQHCRHVSKENALKVVAAYSIFNDGSLRDYQKAAPMLTAGKNFLQSGAPTRWPIRKTCRCAPYSTVP
jgi:2-keto-4-pentenoate hydratase/2-oxohepta-3-ene-1,7-dioic acid hydratase in catechol pathway